MLTRILIAYALLMLTACTTLQQQQTSLATHLAYDLSDCNKWAQSLDWIIETSQVRDHRAAAIDGFPYLRTTRFLSSLRDELVNQKTFIQWLQLLREQDLKARRFEIINLPQNIKTGLPASLQTNDALYHHYTQCSEVMFEHVAASRIFLTQLRDNAITPDSYLTLRRIIGLYPLTGLIVANRIGAYHESIHATFATPLPELKPHGRMIRYAPTGIEQRLSFDQVRQILKNSANNPLTIPQPTFPDLQRLFDTFAPVFEVDTIDDNDRLGAPIYDSGGQTWVDVSRPVVYRLMSHTRMGGRILLQLNYIIWFPARPAAGPNDIYSGKIDGINWRVTLDETGRPLMYDSIHNCGCYHLYFPSPRLRLKDGAMDRFEPPLVPQIVPLRKDNQRLVIRVAHRTHYIDRVLIKNKPSANITYAFSDYDSLRSLPFGKDERKSYFGKKGIVPGSERDERQLLWPMGIYSPGAMRQWGQHAIAFVGRRHFDDVDLFSRFFELSD